MTETVETVRTASTARRALPFGALVVMALTGFIVIATETMPAGLLVEISHDLGTSPGVTGQLVSAYAPGTVVAAIPSTALTRTVRRKPVLLVVLAVGGMSTVLVVVGTALWGAGFGGAATQLQTAMASVAGDNADVANSLLTVAFNLAIFAAAAAGAMLVDGGAATVLPLAMAALSLVALVVVASGRKHAFTP